MSETTNPHFSYFCHANEKINNLLATYSAGSETRPFSYEDPEVFDAFWKGNYEGIDGYDNASPLSEPGNAHEMYWSEHQVSHPETEFIPHLFKFFGANTMAALGHVMSVLRPGPLYVFELYGQTSDEHYPLPLDAAIVLSATRGLPLYLEQAITLLGMYFSVKREEAMSILVQWGKKLDETQDLQVIPFRNEGEAYMKFRFLKAYVGMLWQQSTAFNLAQYEYKQMFLKLYAPELFEQCKHWFYAKATSFAEANPSH